MRRVGHDDAPALCALAALGVVRLEYQERGELGLRAGLRLQRDVIHSGDLGEHLLELVCQREDTLRRAVGLPGMNVCEERCDAIVHLWVVLHRAGPKRIHAGVDRVIQLREVGEMAHHLRLGQLGERQRRLAPEFLRQVRGVVRPHMSPAPARPRELE